MDEEMEDMLGVCPEEYVQNYLSERPLSPILNSSKLNRKIIFGHKKRFYEGKSGGTCKQNKFKKSVRFNDKRNSELPDLNSLKNIDFQDDDLAEKFRKIEELEAEKAYIYNLMYKTDKKPEQQVKDFEFKRPLSSARKKRKYMWFEEEQNEDQNVAFKAEAGDFNSEIEKDVSVFTLMVDTSKCDGFKTAGGKDIQIPEDSIKKQFKLFDDIWQVNQTEKKCHPRPKKPRKFFVLNKSDEYQNEKSTKITSPKKKKFFSYAHDTSLASIDTDKDENLTSRTDNFDNPTALPGPKLISDSGECYLPANYLDNVMFDDINFDFEKSFLEGTEDETTLEYGMNELEKVLSQTIPSCVELKKVDALATSQENLQRKQSLLNILMKEKENIDGRDSSNSVGILYPSTFLLSEPSMSYLDFCGFKEKDYLYSNKILNLCNKIVNTMHEQIDLITNKSESMHNLSQDGSIYSRDQLNKHRNLIQDVEEEIKMYTKLFKVNNFQKIIGYCKDRAGDTNESDMHLFENRDDNSSSSMLQDNQMIKMSNFEPEIFSKTVPVKKFLDRIEEGSEVSSSITTSSANDTNEPKRTVSCSEKGIQVENCTDSDTGHSYASVKNVKFSNSARESEECFTVERKESLSNLKSKQFNNILKTSDNSSDVYESGNFSSSCQPSKESNFTVPDTANMINPSISSFEAAHRKHESTTPKSGSLLNSNIKGESRRNSGTTLLDVSNFSSFKSASGKDIKVSRDAVHKSRSLFIEMLKDESKRQCISSKYQPSSFTKDSGTTIPDVTNFTSSCFKSASGKDIKISEEAFHKTTNIFNIHITDESKKEADLSLYSPAKSKTIFKYKIENPFKVSPSRECRSTLAGDNYNLENARVESTLRKDLEMFKAGIAKSKRLFQEICETSDSTNNVSQNPKTFDFQTASGKNIRTSKTAMEKSRNIFKDLSDLIPYDDFQNSKQDSEKNISEVAFKEMFYNPFVVQGKESSSLHIPFLPDEVKTSIGKEVGISETALEKSKLYPETSKEHLSVKKNNSCPENSGFKTASGKDIPLFENNSARIQKLFDEINEAINILLPYESNSSIHAFQHSAPDSFGCREPSTNWLPSRNENSLIHRLHSSPAHVIFKDASKKGIEDSKKVPVRSREMFMEMQNSASKFTERLCSIKDCLPLPYTTEDQNIQSKGKTQKDIDANISVECPAAEDTQNYNQQTFVSSAKVDTLKKQPAEKENSPKAKVQTPRPPKKRLGVLHCKQIPIPENRVEKMRMFFDNLRNTSSPPSKDRSQSFKKEEGDCSTPSSKVKMQKKTELVNVSPIKSAHLEVSPGRDQTLSQKEIMIIERDESDLYSLKKNIDEEFKMQEIKLKVLSERRQVVSKQISLLEEKNVQLKQQIAGTLYRNKQGAHRISLKDFVERALYTNAGKGKFISSKELQNVCPKNAKKFHFHCPWVPFGKQEGSGYSSVLHTADGAVVVPNSKDYVGLPEIRIAFETMPGVDPKLIPPGWIGNHYKWIIWKLASMERKYPHIFLNCLSIENVMLQLKYRYDREIDRAERPALRKILEKDDTSVKRMVLCISDIKLENDKHELELTDGWYSVRAIIDSPLNNLVLRKKIVVGMKIVVQCAELLNCDGCHPLEMPENVRLKINYNCTRPAHWYAKLGYQKYCRPFPIPLSTVNFEGGLIGCAKVLVIRTFPLRFMEKVNGVTVWRNQRAEEKWAQEWEFEHQKKAEEIDYKVRSAFEKEIAEQDSVKYSSNRVSSMDVSKIQCVKTLHSLIKNSSDPDTIRGKLSLSQQQAVLNYERDLQSERQQALQKRLNEAMKNLMSSRRYVKAVWKLLVYDAYSNSDKIYALVIWRVTEEHIQMIKEGNVFAVYNISPKKNGDFSANSRTRFERLEEHRSPRFNTLKRRLLPISSISQNCGKSLLKEFDTVGTVVQVKVTVHEQELWLTDHKGILLYLKIPESPKYCSLLESLKRGQTVVALNLIPFGPQDQIAQALGNQYTVITSYPQGQFLQDAISSYTQQIKDLEKLLKEAEMKLEQIKIRLELSNRYGCLLSPNLVNPKELFEESSDDGASIPGHLTAMDVAMSLIDTQFYQD